MEVFAGFSENTDWNVGRLIDAVEEMGELDNTLVIYIWGDNGASMEGTITGLVQRDDVFNGLVLNAEEQLALIEKFGGLEGLGGFHSAPTSPAAWAHAQTPVPMGQADGEPPRRRPRPDGHRLAGPHPGRRGGPQPVHPRHRRRADDPRPGRHPGAQDGGRHRAGADGRRAVQLHVRGPGAADRAHRPVLRDVRQPRHLQGRLVGMRPLGQAAVGLLAGDPRPVQAGQRVRPGPGHVGALLPPGRLLAGARHRGREPGEARGAPGALLAGGRPEPGAAAARRHGGVLRRPAADADEHAAHLRG